VKAFLALVAKQGRLDPDLLALVPSLAGQAIAFRDMPHRAENWQSRSGGLVVFAWDNELAAEPTAPLIHVDDLGAVTFTGYICHPAVANPWNVTSVVSAIRLNNDTISGLGGAFAILQANEDDGDVRVWKSISRTAPIYWIDGPGYYGVSTRALLLAFLIAGKPRPIYQPTTLVPFLLRGRFVSEETVFRDVHELAPNACLRVSRFGIRAQPTDDFESTWGSIDPTSSDYDVLVDLLLTSVRPFHSMKSMKVVCSLTGGKDSRVVAATLHHAGIDFTTQTSGSPKSPDVLAAQQVATELGVPHNVLPVATAEIDGQAAVSVNLPGRACRVLFGSDGMLSAYENQNPARNYTSAYVSMGGQGGEVSLRDSYANGFVNWDAALDVLLKYYIGTQIATVEIFEPELLARYETFFAKWLATERDRGRRPNSALDRFALRYDLGVSGIGPVVMAISRPGWYPLLDNQVMKASVQTHERVKVHDELVYNLLVRLAPALVEVPFANDRWNFEKDGPRSDDDAGWARRAPVTAPKGTCGDFNWRRRWTCELYDTFYEQIFGDARAVALFEVLNREAFHAWFWQQRGNENMHQEGTKLAWGAYSASVLLSNAWLGSGESDSTIEIPLPSET
jgi:hypothetical protein